ncbi:Hsp20/alpha crystallin family protein [Paenibacillus xerothermodurans]|uniref:Hsp20/alpha crystallin family protein n=1 Tax=Paenibacillus xerothermodurans TaxID=1977292 RepID=A0A2W1N8J8_PAEXE|nr:Hsp20/alpha crystallin family protein [Paenibacillus xerothermodurans]PZE20919.1 Hsp20/alpha crystallin family protein [Paenibacillus xerothermodurans]
MPLVPFEPLRHVENWKKELDRVFNESIPAAFGFNPEFSTPRTDVYETAAHVIAICEIPGLENKEDVHIHVDNQTLKIHGVINRFNEVQEDQMHRRERYAGKFQRSIALPSPVEAEGTVAAYKNGILEVRMPKSRPEQGQRIDIDFQ